MNFRLRMARFLLNLGSFIQSLPIFIMKADDLVEFGRLNYARPDDVDSWAEDEFVDSGLTPDEVDLLSDLPQKTGELLVLGVGGGRDAIALARMGFTVTGVDYIPEMVERSKQNAVNRGLSFSGLVQEISALDVPAEAYDVVWISRSMYSSIPTRDRRVELVRKIARALKPGGYFLCQFHRGNNIYFSKKGLLLRRTLAFLTFGNNQYEPGDILYLNVEFIHVFNSIEALCSEITDGGLSIIRVQTEISPIRGGAVCRKLSQMS